MSEKTTPKLPTKPLGGSNFPNDELIARIGRGIAATFGPPLMELVQKVGAQHRRYDSFPPCQREGVGKNGREPA